MSSIVTGGGAGTIGGRVRTTGAVAGIGGFAAVKVIAGARASGAGAGAGIPSTTVGNNFGIFGGGPSALSSIVTGGGTGTITATTSGVASISGGSTGKGVAGAGAGSTRTGAGIPSAGIRNGIRISGGAGVPATG